MKIGIFKKDIQTIKKQRKLFWAILIGAVLFAVTVNIVLCLTYDYKFDALFTALNIIVDIVVLWFVCIFYALKLSVQGKLLHLAERVPYGVTKNGKVISVSEKTKRVAGLDCKEIVFQNNKDEFIMFLSVEGNIEIKEQSELTATAVDNIIVEVCDVEEE